MQVLPLFGCVCNPVCNTLHGYHHISDQPDAWKGTTDTLDSSPVFLLGLPAPCSTYSESCTATTTDMTSLMKRQIWSLHLLMTTPSATQRNALLDTISNEQLKSLTELVFNLLKGNIPMTEAQKRKLRKHKTFLKILGNAKVSNSIKREALCRKGAVVTTVLKIAGPQLKQFL